MKTLSIIIANRNDTAMLSVTVSSCIEELRPLGLSNCEIVICDNSDEDIYKSLNSCLPTGYVRDGLLKIIRQDFPCLFTARETAIEKSSSEYVCCVDSHMIIGRDMFSSLVSFMDRHDSDKTFGFAHAPLRWAHHHERRSVHDRDMSTCELGDWNKYYNHERTITWKGMPWICRRDWFLDREKGLNGYGALRDHKVSWGGGDMHIGIKPWILGFKNWAVPTNPAVHIGPFPNINLKKRGNPVDASGESNGYRYRLYGDSGKFPHAFGFLVSCYILGGEAMINRNRKHIENKFGNYINVDKWLNKAIEIGEEEKLWLDKNKTMTFEQLLERKPWDSN